jgi:hypothetical protein
VCTSSTALRSPVVDPLPDDSDYELVRIYHPDSPVARGYPPEVSEARFRTISASYDILRGRRTTLDPVLPHAPFPARVDLHALWRAKQRHRRDPIGPIDDRWKDGVILGSLVVVSNFHSATGCRLNVCVGTWCVYLSNSRVATASFKRGTSKFQTLRSGRCRPPAAISTDE